MGLSIICKKLRAKIKPTIPKTKPQMTLMVIDVCTIFDSLLASLEAKLLAHITLEPTDNPINKLIIKLIKAEVEPTAPSASGSSLNCPTTIKSAALYNNCKIPVNISGRQNKTIFLKKLPFVISTS